MISIENLHEGTWRQLQLRRERLPHALLLSGQPGLGKFELAYRFAATLLCENPVGGDGPCGQCQACSWFKQHNHPDFRLLAPESLVEQLGLAPETGDGADSVGEKSEKKAGQQITMDQVRALEGFLSVGTHRQGLRVILVYPAEAMNRNTANAILKSLEEPPASTLFLMVSSNKSLLLPTIRSRCQAMVVPTPERSRSVAFVREGAGVDAAVAETALSLSGGAPVMAVDLARQLESGWFLSLFGALEAGRDVDVITVAGALDKSLKDLKLSQGLRQVLSWMQKWVFDLAMAGEPGSVRFFKHRQNRLFELSQTTATHELIGFYRRVLIPMFRIVDHPVNSRLFLESLFSQYRALFIK